MSEPSKVLLFGSFTEDEALSWQNRKPGVPKKAEEKKESQVKSVEPIPGLTFGSFGSLASVLPSPAKEPVCSDSSDIQKDTKEASDPLPVTVTGNGEVNISNSFGNGIHEITDGNEFSALHLSDNGSASATNSYSDVIKSNGTYGKSETHNQEAGLNIDVPVIAERDLLPRGLDNKGNLCFLNATLQALMSCTPFVRLLQGLRSRKISKVGYPTLASFVEFIGEFDAPKGANVNKKDTTSLETGRPFSPVMFEVVLKKFTPDVPSSITRRPRQEDAQEFLSFIMDQMHEELLKLKGQSGSDGKSSSVVSISEDDGWETVGPKNKSAVTRTQDIVPSELSSIFGGKLRSVVKAKGNKDSANIEPFLLLHLDISHEAVRTVEDALRLLSAPETLDEYRTSSTKKSGVVAARKSIKIHSLPKIMILHLKRFGYGSHGSTKVPKPVRFPLEMTLNRDLLYSASESRKYELVSTVTHHGNQASKGHYTSDVRHESGRWLRFDDASVKAIPTKGVLHDQAYILFYKQL